MRLIKKNIARQDNLFQGGEPDYHFIKRSLSIEQDDYVVSTGEEDITSVKNWHIYGNVVCTDYLQIRSNIITSFDWNSADSEDKDIIIDYHGRDDSVDENTNDTNKVIHLMSKGMSQQDASLYLLKIFSKHHIKEKESCYKRANSEKVTEIMVSFLSIHDSRDFIETTKTLLDLYVDRAVIGTNYGSAGLGIIDYIDSTSGTVYEFAGLSSKGYTLKNGTINDFINSLKDVLINGNY
jgi:hypothetical protein